MKFYQRLMLKNDMSLRGLIYILLTIIFLVSLGLVVTSVEVFVQYSAFPIGLAKATMGVLLLKIIDDTVFGRIDTIPEIKSRNISYGLIYLANAIIIAACIASA